MPFDNSPMAAAATASDIISDGLTARLVVERKVDVEKLFTHRWQLDQAEES